MRPMMTTTTMISIKVKPRVKPRADPRIGCEATGRARLLEVPVANVGIFSFAAFLSVGSEGVKIVFLAARSRENILVWIAPRIERDALQVSAFAPVAHRRIVRTLHQCLEAEIGARKL